ncbi:hypothetical protein EDD17DRAFT_1634240 [Pisolithus thermaeus]|nr:hypothetical protein EDD17DRAFT_1634240 [Pisolithus thermaeus]
MRVMESRLRYQIEKLVRVTDESPKAVTEGISAGFQNFVNEQLDEESGEDTVEKAREDGIFHRLRSAPMSYVGTTSNKHSKRRPAPKTLSSLIHHSLLWSPHLQL